MTEPEQQTQEKPLPAPLLAGTAPPAHVLQGHKPASISPKRVSASVTDALSAQDSPCQVRLGYVSARRAVLNSVTDESLTVHKSQKAEALPQQVLQSTQAPLSGSKSQLLEPQPKSLQQIQQIDTSSRSSSASGSLLQVEHTSSKHSSTEGSPIIVSHPRPSKTLPRDVGKTIGSIESMTPVATSEEDPSPTHSRVSTGTFVSLPSDEDATAMNGTMALSEASEPSVPSIAGEEPKAIADEPTVITEKPTVIAETTLALPNGPKVEADRHPRLPPPLVPTRTPSPPLLSKSAQTEISHSVSTPPPFPSKSTHVEPNDGSPTEPPRVPLQQLPPRPPSQAPIPSGMIDARTILQRLFNNPLYSDVTLTVDETTFHVHRGILAEQCGYFRELLERTRSRDPTNEVKTIDCSYKPVGGYIRPSTGTSLQQGKMPAERRVSIFEADVPSKTEYELQSDHQESVHMRTTHTMGGETVPSTIDCTMTATGATCQPPLDVCSGSTGGTNNKNVANIKSSHDHESQCVSNAMMLASGYNARHFGYFLQILYGIQQPSTVFEQTETLLPVFRIAHVYGLVWLAELLAEQIFQRLELSTKTWSTVLQFAERYQLATIRRATIEFASSHRNLWTLAVETLSLQDFKVFLRAIPQNDTDDDEDDDNNDDDDDDEAEANFDGKGRSKGHRRLRRRQRLRSLKDELLMMFLLVHHQGADSSIYETEKHRQQQLQQTALLRRLSKGHSRRQKTLSESSSIKKIRHQLQFNDTTKIDTATTTAASSSSSSSSQGKPSMGGQWSGHHIVSASNDDESSCRPLVVSVTSENDEHGDDDSTNNRIISGNGKKAEEARSWMRCFKMECGWEGQFSALDFD
ncbi:hypothetical protein BGZ94_000477 [Podila epigama]|nr:hypothetical protein BGZ94_000477 [Podila epigama]